MEDFHTSIVKAGNNNFLVYRIECESKVKMSTVHGFYRECVHYNNNSGSHETSFGVVYLAAQ